MSDITAFRNFTLVNLEAMLAASQTNMTAQGLGKTVLEYSIGGRTVRKEFAISPADFMAALNWALTFKDPDNYPPLDDRTLAKFS